MSLIGLHGFVAGHVQGVGFRRYTREKAHDLGVNGWVRNLPDGRVEVWLEGGEPEVQALAAWLHHGPAGGEVTSLTLEPAVPEGHSAFVIRQ